MKVMLIGAGGQLGGQLKRLVPAHVKLTAVSRAELDLSRRADIRQLIHREAPDLIINAAAYTAVDHAESDVALAMAVNAKAPEAMAIAAAEVGARFWHISTDFVFDGNCCRPYKTSDAPNPLSVYGKSKLEGEQRAMAAAPGAVSIVRTAWVYAPGGRNFVRSMLRLLEQRDLIGVVDDQIGTPTHAAGLAEAIWCLVAHGGPAKIWHWTDAGVASWYDFACAVRELAAQCWPDRNWGIVRPISSSAYPTPAHRPAYAVLDKSATWAVTGAPLHWRSRLAAAMGTEKPNEWLAE